MSKSRLFALECRLAEAASIPAGTHSFQQRSVLPGKRSGDCHILSCRSLYRISVWGNDWHTPNAEMELCLHCEAAPKNPCLRLQRGVQGLGAGLQLLQQPRSGSQLFGPDSPDKAPVQGAIASLRVLQQAEQETMQLLL